jgi:hypothetical protein
MALTIKQDRIIDSWAQIIENGAGNNIRLMQMTETFLKDANPSDVRWGKTDVSTGLLGKKRDFLLVTHANLLERV